MKRKNGEITRKRERKGSSEILRKRANPSKPKPGTKERGQNEMRRNLRLKNGHRNGKGGVSAGRAGVRGVGFAVQRAYVYVCVCVCV